MSEINIEYSVDKGIKIPVKKALPLSSLQVGESIEFPITRRSQVAVQASSLKRRVGKTYTVRKVDEEKCRVWRTE